MSKNDQKDSSPAILRRAEVGPRVIEVLRGRHGPMRISDIETAVADLLRLPPELRTLRHRADDPTGHTRLRFKLMWVLRDLKSYGIVVGAARSGYRLSTSDPARIPIVRELRLLEGGPTPRAEASTFARTFWLVGTGEGASQWKMFQRDAVIAVNFPAVAADLASLRDDDILRRLRESASDGVNPIHDARACVNFSRRIREGDVVIARVGRREILGVGVVTGGYQFITSSAEYSHRVPVRWLSTVTRRLPGRILMAPKTLTPLDAQGPLGSVVLGRRTPEAVGWLESKGVSNDEIRDFFSQPEIVLPEATSVSGTLLRGQPPSFAELKADYFGEGGDIEQMLASLTEKKALLLVGAPGTGKSYLADLLARHFAGQRGVVQRVQFHAAYGYEDFIRGIRPTEAGGFEVEDGALLELAASARKDPEVRHVLLIDEMNRGNVSRIFGEALSLLEHDKRGPAHTVRLGLARRGERTFFLPENVHVIATMNSADRSLAYVDHALLRRFVRYQLKPAYGEKGFREWLAAALSGEAGDASARIESEEVVSTIIEKMTALNLAITSDRALGDGWAVGHSYFCSYDDAGGRTPKEWMAGVFKQEIHAVIDEYCREHPKTRQRLLDALGPLA